MNNRLDVTSLFLQALSLEILFKDYNNTDLMTELQHQNKDYLGRIISQNNEILSILRKENNNNGNGNSREIK